LWLSCHMKNVRAIIADDEEPLRTYLKKKLSVLWPVLEIMGEARDGEEALRLIRDKKPDIAFLDIKMPGLSGIEVASRASGACLFVFVTAHDAYAVEAFEREAVDYLLKPVSDDRLKKTVKRLKSLVEGSTPAPDLSEVLQRVTHALQKRPGHLQWIKAQHKDGIRLVPVSEVYYFKATDKYTTLRTKEGELLIRKTIKELEDELDPDQFWRVHRGALVNVRSIHAVDRAMAGTLVIRFRDIQDRVAVSRAFAHLFKQM